MSIPLIIVSHKNDPEKRGVIVDHFINQVIMTNPETGAEEMQAVPMAAVCWDDTRTPAICYYSPTELTWIDIPELVDEEDQSEDDNNEGVSASRTMLDL